MTGDEFTAALTALGWKQSDLARRLELDKNTPSRWAHGHTAVPAWAGEYLRAMLALKQLHADFLEVRRPASAALAAGADDGPADA